MVGVGLEECDAQRITQADKDKKVLSTMQGGIRSRKGFKKKKKYPRLTRP